MEDQSGTILVGYDGSDDAEAAMRSAAEVLAPRRAVVAYVWDSLAALLLHTDPDGLTGTLREAADELDQDDAEAARTLAARGAELAEELGLQAVSVAARGKPKAWPTLLELAAEHDARALVVGSRGLGRVSSALLGSVSSGVLDHADLPVFVVPPSEDRWAPGPIVIAYDGSEEAKSAVDVGGHLLKVREVVVQTVWTSYGAVASAGVARTSVGVVTKPPRRSTAPRGSARDASSTRECAWLRLTGSRLGPRLAGLRAASPARWSTWPMPTGRPPSSSGRGAGAP